MTRIPIFESKEKATAYEQIQKDWEEAQVKAGRLKRYKEEDGTENTYRLMCDCGSKTFSISATAGGQYELQPDGTFTDTGDGIEEKDNLEIDEYIYCTECGNEYACRSFRDYLIFNNGVFKDCNSLT